MVRQVQATDPGDVRRRSRMMRTLVAATALAAVGATALNLWALDGSRRAARDEVARNSGMLATALERDIARSIDLYDQSLRALAGAPLQPGPDALDAGLRQSALVDGAATAPHFGRVLVTDAEGTVVRGSAGTAPLNINLADHEYFRAQRDREADSLFIGTPMRGALTGEWGIVLSRRLQNPDGSFAGIVCRFVDAAYFEQLLSRSGLLRSGSAVLLHADGRMVARAPAISGAHDPDDRGAAVLARLARASSGSFEAVAEADGVRRLYTSTTVENTPLLLTIGAETRALDAAWWRKSAPIGGAVAVLCTAVLLLAVLLLRELRRSVRAERLARRTGAQFRSFVAHSPDGLFMLHVNPGPRFLLAEVNPAFATAAGKPEAALLGRGLDEVLPADAAWELETRCREAAATGRTVSHTDRLDLPAGECTWHVILTPILDADGRVTTLLGSARDLTSHERLEEQLRQAQKMEAIGQLTAGVAHDFNNLLQAVLGGLDLLEEQVEAESESGEFVRLASQAARRGAVLTHRLLAFSRRQILNPEPLDLARAAEGVRELLSHTLGAHIRIETAIEPGTWPVHADAGQLEACLLNLAINARDAMPSGGTLSITARNAHSSESPSSALADGHYVVVTVADTGAGMDATVLARVFEPFFTTKPVGKGSGLGLPMVHGFARQSGGDVHIASAPGQGTRVELWLPRAHTVEAAAAAEPATSHSGHGRVLVVDDEPHVRRVLAAFLSASGFETAEAEDALAALHMLETGERFDLLVTDQSMPDMSGVELLGRAQALCPDLPALMITGYDKAMGLEGLPAGIPLLRKPVHRAEFIGQVIAAIGQRSSTARTDEAVPTEASPTGDATPGNVVPLRRIRAS